MVPTVVIHTCEDDAHASEVAKHLYAHGAKACLLHRETCFDEWCISCRNDDVLIKTKDGSYGLTDISSVFIRRDYFTEPAWVKCSDLDEGIRDFIADQRAIHVDSAFKRLQKSLPFINSVDSNRASSSKALQHNIARSNGMRVPETYIGSDPEQARVFVEGLWQTGRRCCSKNMESSHALIDGVKHARLTHLLNEDEVESFEDLSICPMIFQEYIEKKYEYRVTVVGNDVFACCIDSQSAGGVTAVDWRHYNIPSTPHFASTLEDDLKASLIKIVHDLGLTYGAIDLVENPNGEFFFLEVNSMGQWLWIEELTELPISSSIARHLLDPGLIRR